MYPRLGPPSFEINPPAIISDPNTESTLFGSDWRNSPILNDMGPPSSIKCSDRNIPSIVSDLIVLFLISVIFDFPKDTSHVSFMQQKSRPILIDFLLYSMIHPLGDLNGLSFEEECLLMVRRLLVSVVVVSQSHSKCRDILTSLPCDPIASTIHSLELDHVDYAITPTSVLFMCD